jgi:hypothetical protein
MQLLILAYHQTCEYVEAEENNNMLKAGMATRRR